MRNRSAYRGFAPAMAWIWLGLFRLIVTLVLGYALAHSLQERLVSLTRIFRQLP